MKQDGQNQKKFILSLPCIQRVRLRMRFRKMFINTCLFTNLHRVWKTPNWS